MIKLFVLCILILIIYCSVHLHDMNVIVYTGKNGLFAP